MVRQRPQAGVVGPDGRPVGLEVEAPVARREAVEEVRHPYVADVFDRDYRRVDGYSLKVKLKEARDRAGTAGAEDAACLQGGS